MSGAFGFGGPAPTSYRAFSNLTHSTMKPSQIETTWILIWVLATYPMP